MREAAASVGGEILPDEELLDTVTYLVESPTAVTGSFDVLLDDGVECKRFQLNRSYYGLYVPPMVWRELDNFSSGAVSLVLASEPYGEPDYYREYNDFLNALRV